jgi:hypothetical protein
MQREESNCEKKGEKLIKREENYIWAHYVDEMKKCKKEEEK